MGPPKIKSLSDFEVSMAGDPFYVLNRPCVLGEGPIYRSSDSTLHYVDCLSNPPQLHILDVDPKTGDAKYPHPLQELLTALKNNKNVSRPGLRVVDLKDSVTVQFFRKNHPKSYICAYYQGIAFMDEETGDLEVLKEIIPESERHIRRFNDGAVDCAGRFWAAEIDVKGLAYGAKKLPADYGEPLGRLWRYDPDGTLTQMESGLLCGNGLAWSPDNKVMYLNDLVAQKVYRYDFDARSGSITNKRLFIDTSDGPCEPDGMVADSEGNLWIAMFNGTCVLVYNDVGREVKRIHFTSKCMACTTWGGEDNNILYVVSAYNKFEDIEGDTGGHLFMEKTSARGIPKYEFAG